MNLLVKRLGQLAVLAVALIFFSCEDETSLGFKNPKPKFDINYVELTLPTSTILLDSVRTSNFTFPNESNRLLVGEYQDPQFGNVTATTFTQFYPVTTVADNATYDSITLQLSFDLYWYGARNTSTQRVGIYEVVENFDTLAVYKNKSSLPINEIPLAEKSFTVNPNLFDQYIKGDSTSRISVTMSMPFDYGKEIFDFAVAEKTNTPKNYYLKFMSSFKGIAIKPLEFDKVVGLDMSSANTKLTIHYHTPSDTLTFNMNFQPPSMNFTQIQLDPTGEVASLIPFVKADLSQNYIQAGTGIVTAVDLSPFLALVDSTENIIINQAQLVINGLVGTDLAPPAGLALRLLNEENRFYRWTFDNDGDNEIDSASVELLNYALYGSIIERDAYTPSRPVYGGSGAAYFDNDRSAFVKSDFNSPAVLQYTDASKSYSGFMTGFFQQLLKKDTRTRFTDFAFYPISPNGGKSVNRSVFGNNDVKLQIYYTKPLITP